MKTIHQYLSLYPIAADSKKLIVGTIHPHDHHNFKIPFFYGNKLSIWNILNEAFPGELGNPITLENILAFLQKKKIAVSDTIQECLRKNPTALDSDLIPTKLNYVMLGQIRESAVTEILFTSGFQKNNAFKLFFVDILGQKLTQKIRDDRGVLLDPSYFGRAVQLTVLYSPAGTANTGLVKSRAYIENKQKYIHSKHPVKDFKSDYYKTKFNS